MLCKMQLHVQQKMTSKFRSGLEKDVANLLTELGVTYEYESTKIAYQISHNYCPDFVLPNGTVLELSLIHI